MPATKTPPKAVKKTTAAPTPAPAAPAPAAPLEWSDLAIAAQVEVAADGSVINPFTKAPIAKAVNGLLDVRRPANAALLKPENIKVSGSVAATFAKWYMDKCYISPVSAEEVKTRFDLKEFALPDLALDVEQSPVAFVTGKYGETEYGFSIVNGQIGRVGRRTERGYVWCFSDQMRKVRGDKMCPRSVRASSAEDAFKTQMASFDGKFRLDVPAPEPKAPKAAKTTPTKATAKAAPKKVPTKK